MLDSGVPDLELRAIIVALRVKGESLDEMLGFMAALNEQINRIAPYQKAVSGRLCYLHHNGARKANQLPAGAQICKNLVCRWWCMACLGFGRVTTGRCFVSWESCLQLHLPSAGSWPDSRLALPLNVLCPESIPCLICAAEWVSRQCHSLVRINQPDINLMPS